MSSNENKSTSTEKKNREYLGLSLEEAAKILNKNKLVTWERQLQLLETEVELTYKELAEIAEKYCCDVGDFLLKEFNKTEFKSDFRIRENQLEELQISNNYNLKKRSINSWQLYCEF